MTHELFSESDNWEVENDGQDVRGWSVVDDQGQTIGKVSDMYVDTQTETIDRLVLDNGSEIDVNSLEVGDGEIRVASAMAGSTGYGSEAGTGGMATSGAMAGSTGTNSEIYTAGSGSQVGSSYGTDTGSGMTGTDAGYASSQGGTTDMTGTGDMSGMGQSGIGSSQGGTNDMTGTGDMSGMGRSTDRNTDAWRLRRQGGGSLPADDGAQAPGTTTNEPGSGAL
jgi:hypothetical protein